MTGYAIGEFQVDYNTARNMSLWEFSKRIDGKKRNRINNLKTIRWAVATLLQPHAKKGQTLSPEKILQLEGDIDSRPRMTKAQIMDDVERKLNAYRGTDVHSKT